ncbi:uncharacterized protein LOC142341324 [Convolutriloba macropyga]|uniref:uncharacterized protein LOC142341324 n=1 Tax=Convolutriloba macropyga TaxID=536237 RepID=UPI003F51F8CD
MRIEVENVTSEQQTQTNQRTPQEIANHISEQIGKKRQSDTRRNLDSFCNRTKEQSFLFYGIDFELDVCSNVKLVAGASDFAGMLADSTTCMSNSFSIDFNQSLIENWDVHHKKFEKESAFTSSIKRLMEKKSAEHQMSLSIIIVRGPSIWIEQDAIYMRVLAPKYNTLHPYYILSSFDKVSNTLERVANISVRGEPVEALVTLQRLLEEDKAVFRYLPTESMTLASMFKEEFEDEGVLYHTRITLESTVSNTMYSTDDWDCTFADYRDYVLSNLSALPTHSLEDGGGSRPSERTNTSKPTTVSPPSADEVGSEGDGPNNWSHHDKSYEDIVSTLCKGTSANLSYSESTFRWFDGLVRVTNTYDPFDPWSIFTTLTSIVLAVDRIYTTLKRYKTAYTQHHQANKAAESQQQKEFSPVDKRQGISAFIVHENNPKLTS